MCSGASGDIQLSTHEFTYGKFTGDPGQYVSGHIKDAYIRDRGMG